MPFNIMCSSTLIRFGISRVDTLHNLAWYLAYTTNTIFSHCITRYLQQTHGHWKVQVTARLQLAREKEQMFIQAYPATLIELWLYSLGKVTPLLENNSNTELLYQVISSLFKQQLQTQAQLEKNIDLEQATQNFLQLLQKTDLSKKHGLDPSPMLISHLEELIDTPSEKGVNIITGYLRSQTMKFTHDWNETVITESLISEINQLSEDETTTSTK